MSRESISQISRWTDGMDGSVTDGQRDTSQSWNPLSYLTSVLTRETSKFPGEKLNAGHDDIPLFCQEVYIQSL